MADFGAGIIMRNADRRGEYADRLFRLAQLQEQKRQFDNKPSDLTMDEQALQDVMAYQNGTASPLQKARLEARAAMEGNKTEYSKDAYGNLVPQTTPNAFAKLLSLSQAAGGDPAMTMDPIASETPDAYPPQPTMMSSEDAALNRLQELAAFDGEIPEQALTPEQFRMIAMGEATADDFAAADNIPTLPEAGAGYAGSPAEQVAQGEARADLQKAGSMLPIDKAKAEIQTDEKIREKQETSKVDALTEAQKAVDQEFAKEYVAYKAKGGFSDTQKQVEQLREVEKRLNSGEENLTGVLLGLVPTDRRAMFNEGSVDTQELVEEVVQRSLRTTLGAQFTEKEGERLIARAYNPKLDEKINAKRVGRLIQQIGNAASVKQDAINYFEKNGTLNGWQGKLPSLSDFDPDAPASGSEAAGKRRRYNPQTGRLE